MVVFAAYIGVIPFLETPDWCLRKFENEENFDRSRVVLNCRDFGVPFSGNPTLSPILLVPIDLLCLAFLNFFQFFKYKWQEQKSPSGKRRDKILLSITIFYVLDGILAIVLYQRPYLSELLRPVVSYLVLKTVRSVTKQTIWNLVDSTAILSAIGLFICFYSAIGHFAFRYTFEGYQSFNTIN